MNSKTKNSPNPTVDDNSVEEDSSNDIINKQVPTGLWMVLMQVFVVTLFMFGVVGAFYYVINNAESNGRANTSFNIDWQNVSQNYSALFSQYSSAGSFVLSLKTINAPEKESLLRFSSFWYQDHDKSEIVHQYDDKTVAFVKRDSTFWTTQINGIFMTCKRQNLLEGGGYLGYLKDLGIIEMENRHTEFERIQDGHKIYIFDSEPFNSNFPINGKNYAIGNAILVNAFIDAETGAFLNWQKYYSNPFLSLFNITNANETLCITRWEYSFPGIKRETPTQVPKLPSICKKYVM